MREAQHPKDGYIFRHKVNTDTFARELYLADGESIDDWEEITEAEYESEQVKAMMMLDEQGV